MQLDTKNSSNNKPARYTIVTLLFIIAINAFAGGYYGVAGAKNIPLEWLHGTPFRTYTIPGLILFVCVGGTCLASAVLVLKRHRHTFKAAITSASVILGWIGVQVALIGYVSWLQPAVALIGLAILLLSRFLSRTKSSGIL